MNKAIKYMLVFFFCGLSFFSCKKQQDPQELNIDQFPLAVGNWWRYSHVGAFGSPNDTVTVLIDSMKSVSSGLQYFCSARNSTFLFGTVIFTKKANLINVTGNDLHHNFFGDVTMNFPIRKGEQWTGICSTDVFNVQYVDSTGSFQREYHNVYSIDRRYHCDTASFSSNYFMCPNIGFFNLSIDEQYYNSLPNSINMYLLDYKVQ